MPLLKKARWMFINKETGKLQLSDGTNVSDIEGLIATITGVKPLIKEFKHPLPKTLKAIFTFNDGIDEFCLWAGGNSFLTKWLCYAIVNERFDVTLPVTFTVKKTDSSQAILPNIQQRGEFIVIKKEGLPLTKAKSIDWAELLGEDASADFPMKSVIEGVNSFILHQQETKGIAYPAQSPSTSAHQSMPDDYDEPSIDDLD